MAKSECVAGKEVGKRGGSSAVAGGGALYTGCLPLEIHKIFMLQLVHSPIACAAHELWIDP